MGKRFIICIHSYIDLITNSSTEIFVVDASKIEEHLNEIWKYIKDGNVAGVYDDVKARKIDASDNEEIEWIEDNVPKGTNLNNCYMISIDRNEMAAYNILKKLLPVITELN